MGEGLEVRASGEVSKCSRHDSPGEHFGGNELKLPLRLDRGEGWGKVSKLIVFRPAANGFNSSRVWVQ